MTNIDASLRRAILPETQATFVSDSTAELDPAPQIIIDAGVSRPVWKFDDGLGLTDAYGNVFEGYSSGGFTFRSSKVPASSIDETADAANDLDVLQFNATTEKYDPKALEDAQIGRFSALPGEQPADGETPIFDLGDGVYKPQPAANPIITDFISYIIQTPEDRTYTLVQDLPYDITIFETHSSIDTGSANVSFPSGTITAGNPVNVTVSATSVDAEYLRIQIDFLRDIGG